MSLWLFKAAESSGGTTQATSSTTYILQALLRNAITWNELLIFLFQDSYGWNSRVNETMINTIIQLVTIRY